MNFLVIAKSFSVFPNTSNRENEKSGNLCPTCYIRVYILSPIMLQQLQMALLILDEIMLHFLYSERIIVKQHQTFIISVYVFENSKNVLMTLKLSSFGFIIRYAHIQSRFVIFICSWLPYHVALAKNSWSEYLSTIHCLKTT